MDVYCLDFFNSLATGCVTVLKGKIRVIDISISGRLKLGQVRQNSKNSRRKIIAYKLYYNFQEADMHCSTSWWFHQVVKKDQLVLLQACHCWDDSNITQSIKKCCKFWKCVWLFVMWKLLHRNKRTAKANLGEVFEWTVEVREEICLVWLPFVPPAAQRPVVSQIKGAGWIYASVRYWVSHQAIQEDPQYKH